MLTAQPQLILGTGGPHPLGQHKLCLLGQSSLFVWDALCPRLKPKQTPSLPNHSTLGTETFCFGEMLHLSPSVSRTFLLIDQMPWEGEGDSMRGGTDSFSVRVELDKVVYTFKPSSSGFSLPSQALQSDIHMTAHLLLLQVPNLGWLQGTSTRMVAAGHPFGPLGQSLFLLSF